MRRSGKMFSCIVKSRLRNDEGCSTTSRAVDIYAQREDVVCHCADSASPANNEFEVFPLFKNQENLRQPCQSVPHDPRPAANLSQWLSILPFLLRG